MCCYRLRKLVGLCVCLTLLLLTGCYSMNGYVMNASGQGYYDQGNYAMAGREFQTALASNPRNPDYMANLAKTRMKLGDQAGAEQLYQQALTMSPSHQPSYHGYSELLLTQNRSQEALRMMNTWAATQPYIAESHVELAWLQRELGQNDVAAQTLQTALQVNPNHATALAHLGQYYQESGQPTQAVAMYQKALRADWSQPEVHSRLAMAAESAGANHPMGEMAMSRGVHPNSLPRQQFAFGPPAGVPQMAHMSGPSQQQQAMAYQPQPGAFPQVAYHGGQQQFTSPPNVVPQQAFNPMHSMPFGGGTVTSAPASSGQPTPMNATSEIPMPVPDPAFSTGDQSLPVTSVSSSKLLSSEAPAVEAF